MNSAMMLEKLHADNRVELHAGHLPRRLLRRLYQRLGLRILFLVFDFLAGLPEEEVWADRSAEHGDDGGQIVAR